MDKIVRGISKDKSIRFFGVDATKTVQEASLIHNLSMTNSVILGRTICAALMMAIELKSKRNVLTLKIDGDGPAGSVIVTAKNDGNVKCYTKTPEVELPLNKQTNSFDIQKAIGYGTLTVIKDLGMKSPYIGQVDLKFRTIAKDLTYYFAQSEQVPSSVGLGVLVMPDGTIKRAGGFIIQILPGTSDKIIANIEKNLSQFPNLTDMMDMGHCIEELLVDFILKAIDVKITETTPASYACDCSKEKFENGLKLLSKEELKQAIDNDETLKVKCHFCNSEYAFNKEEIQKLLENM